MKLNFLARPKLLIIIGICIAIVGIIIFIQAVLQPPITSPKLLASENQTSPFIEKQYPAPFLNKGWIRNIRIDYSTYNQDFVTNKRIFFTIQADITRPVKDFTVNIFNENDKFYFT